MSLQCNHCQGTGFLNIEQIEDGAIRDGGTEAVLLWMRGHQEIDHDVQVCDCCGDGEETWHGVPGEHYNAQDPPGHEGPYGYNGWLCECH
jgi:hypothetical protein